jgi:hypothetical protein
LWRCVNFYSVYLLYHSPALPVIRSIQLQPADHHEPTMDSIQSHLKQTTGLTPSTSWLTACTSHLRLNPDNNNATEEIWNQILHSDLRDVVHDPLGEGHCESSKLLKEGIDASVREGKATLTGFKLLVQLEEVVDVSLNGEGQLGGNDGNANTNNYNNQRNKSRMLKLALSSGTTPQIIAMETSPIPQLSTKTPPGTKLLLCNSLLIRHGMIQINPSNCIVVGGRIEEWEEIARKSREKEGKLRGMGVDATVKALIWCPEADDEDGELPLR